MAVEAERSGSTPLDTIPECAKCGAPDMTLAVTDDGICWGCQAKAQITAQDGAEAWQMWVAAQTTRTARVIPLRRTRRRKAA